MARIGSQWMLVIIIFINALFSLCSANTTSVGRLCTLPSLQAFKDSRSHPLRLVRRREKECLLPSKTFIWNSLYLFLCGDFPQALLSSVSELIFPPFCVTFASMGGGGGGRVALFTSSHHHGNLVFWYRHETILKEKEVPYFSTLACRCMGIKILAQHSIAGSNVKAKKQVLLIF